MEETIADRIGYLLAITHHDRARAVKNLDDAKEAVELANRTLASIDDYIKKLKARQQAAYRDALLLKRPADTEAAGQP